MARYTLAQVIEGRRDPICAQETMTVGEAMQVMLTQRISQLPVVTGDGALKAIVSQQTILSLYFHAGGQVNLLELPVRHCQEPVTSLDVGEDLLKAVEYLQARGVAAVVVTEGERPIGVLTGRDMTYFFHSLFEGLLMVEQIEVTLRDCVAQAFQDAEAKRSALMAAFGPHKKDANKPARGQDYMSFTDLVRVITHEANWSRFDGLLGPKTLFDPLMERSRGVRNQLSHFQGRPDPLGMDALRRTVLWMSNLAAASDDSGTVTVSRTQMHSLSTVVAKRKRPLCVEQGVSTGDALRTMTENRFGQLPVVDSEGILVGMVSQQGILALYYHTRGNAPILDLPIHHVMEAALALDKEDSLYEAVNALVSPGAYAAVITENGKPAALLTGKDMTRFFRSLFEGIMLVEEIEMALRDHVKQALPDPDTLNAAAIATFGPDLENPHFSRRNPHKLTFGDRVWMMCDDDNWPLFEPVLGPREVFSTLMERVRQVRNELMHFSGELDPLEHDALVRAYRWLQNRPAWPAPATTVHPGAAIEASGATGDGGAEAETVKEQTPGG